MDISIIIVHYKTPKLLQKCIDSIKATKNALELEVIVIDNDSKDGSKEILCADFPSLVWINSGYNAGFSRANNIGINRAKGKHILILNPDSYVGDGFLPQYLQRYKELDSDGKLGQLGCRILSSVDGSLLIGSGIGFPSIWNYVKANPLYIFLTRKFIKQEKKYIPSIEHYKNHEVDFVSGACVLIKKSKILENGLYFDEDFFLYFEDVEWSYRIKEHGFFNYFCGDLEMYHVNSASTSKSKYLAKQKILSSYLFFYKVLDSLEFAVLGLLLRFNFFLNDCLLKAKEEVDQHKAEKLVFKNYFYRLPKEYKKKASSNSKYLNYVE